MGEDRRFNGNTRYKDEGIKVYGACKKERIGRKTGKGIFTAATVERYMGEER